MNIDVKAQRIFIGNTALDHYRSLHRHPVLLERNIMRVLQSHDKRRAKPRMNGEASRPFDGTPLRSLPQSRSSRSFRDRDKPAFHEKDAELTVELIGLRRKLNFKPTAKDDLGSPAKRIRRDDIPCQCYLAVWDNRLGFFTSEPIVKQTRTCSVEPYDAADGTVATRIRMEEPFKLKARELLVPIKKEGMTTVGIGDKYVMELKILPQRSTDKWPPIPVLNKSDASLNPDGTSRGVGTMDGLLVSNYLNLPFAPSNGVPLSVSFDHCGRTNKSKYGFEVIADWSAPSSVLEQQVKREAAEESPIPWYNEPRSESVTKKPKPVRKPRQVREHVLLSDTVRVKPKTSVCYIVDPLIQRIEKNFRAFQTCRVEGYCCPVCRLESRTLRQLQFHLSSNHGKFTFTAEKDERGADSNLPSRVTIRVEEAEVIRERASDHVKDPREISWVAPRLPLDVDAYLDGDSTWVGGPNKKRKLPRPPAKPGSLAASYRNPSEVPDLPKTQRERHPIPKPKTAISIPTGYRSISHQIVEEGEELTESDDELDLSWLKQKHRARLTEDRASSFENETQRRLRIAFDEHLIDEQFPNTRYISDSFVRFLRNMKKQRQDWLWNEQGRIEIIKLCAEMFEDNIMNNEPFTGILRLIETPPAPNLQEKPTSPEIDETDFMIVDDFERSNAKEHLKHRHSITSGPPTLRDPDRYRHCAICNEVVTHKSKTQICNRLETCTHPWRTYHISCVQLECPSMEWKCGDCETDQRAAEAKKENLQHPMDPPRPTIPSLVRSPVIQRKDKALPPGSPTPFAASVASEFVGLSEPPPIVTVQTPTKVPATLKTSTPSSSGKPTDNTAGKVGTPTDTPKATNITANTIGIPMDWQNSTSSNGVKPGTPTNSRKAAVTTAGHSGTSIDFRKAVNANAGRPGTSIDSRKAANATNSQSFTSTINGKSGKATNTQFNGIGTKNTTPRNLDVVDLTSDSDGDESKRQQSKFKNKPLVQHGIVDLTFDGTNEEDLDNGLEINGHTIANGTASSSASTSHPTSNSVTPETDGERDEDLGQWQGNKLFPKSPLVRRAKR